MKQFFDNYFNINKMIKSKREYKQQMKRVKALPEDYRYVYKQIQNHMWQFVSGSGYDMLEVQCDLIDLFEEGAANAKKSLGNNRRRCSWFCRRTYEKCQNLYAGLEKQIKQKDSLLGKVKDDTFFVGKIKTVYSGSESLAGLFFEL